MTKEDILRLRDTAEQTRVQFKERVTRDNKYDVSCEMVAQSNSRGGMIVVGIDDKTGRINPLSFVEVQETTNLLGSLASEGVVPQILLDIENVQMDDGSCSSIMASACCHWPHGRWRNMKMTPARASSPEPVEVPTNLTRRHAASWLRCTRL